MSLEFPRLVYKKGGRYACKGGTYDHKLAADERAFEALIADGWVMSMAEILGEVVVEEIDTSAPTRKELEQKAIELEVTFSSRTPDKALLAMINERIEELEEAEAAQQLPLQV